MRGGSCFSGVGGLDLGLEQAGVEVAWQVEIDPFRRSILARHWPEVTRYEDIKAISGEETAPIDLLFGGFPCQDLSYAGQRKGIERGERSSLFFEFARLAGILQPRWLLVENVPGLLSSHEGQDMGIVIETLSELGYGLSWHVLDSQYFGVPQRRRRVYIVGCLGRPCPPAVLFERTGGGGHPSAGGKAGQEVANPLGAGSIGRSRRQDLELETYIPDVAYGLPASARGTGDRHGNAWNSTYVIEDVGGKQSGDGRVGLGVREGPMYSLQRGHQHGIAFSENQRGEVVLTDYAHQLGGGGGKPGQGYPAALVGPIRSHPRPGSNSDGSMVCSPIDADRDRTTTRISGELDVPRTLIDDCGCKDAARYAACGDAVTVDVARWIGIRLIVVDELMQEGVL